jgi:hypothetical protein
MRLERWIRTIKNGLGSEVKREVEGLEQDRDCIKSGSRVELELEYLQGLLDLEELVRRDSNKDAK